MCHWWLINDRLCTDAAAFDTIFSRPAMSSDTLYRLAFPSIFKKSVLLATFEVGNLFDDID